jgi:lipopolysaccharide transport system ATP-binding protein
MSNKAIIVENLSKRYRIGLKEKVHDSLAGAIASWVKAPLSNYNRLRKLSKFEENGEADDIIWALRNVSFGVEEGEVLGVIGRNGAGKSTLLKILSRITDATSGTVRIKSKVSSLLEVGTGFHPELTGRENVYLNGTIIGMSKKEIDNKFDAIVEFSGIERFIDTPIKRYSSGMTVRLAFAVAAHIEPQILIVDEVLAVGDIEFQKKCIGKMSDVAKGGRTVLFVSHNMMAVENLCTRAIWIENGSIAQDGGVSDVIRGYIKSSSDTRVLDSKRLDRRGNGDASFQNVKTLDCDGHYRDTFSMGETIIIEFEILFYRELSNLHFAITFRQTHTGLNVFHLTNNDCDFHLENILKGTRIVRVEIPNCLLYPNTYDVSLYVDNRSDVIDDLRNICTITMLQSNVSKRTTPFYNHLGIIHHSTIWREIERG